MTQIHDFISTVLLMPRLMKHSGVNNIEFSKDGMTPLGFRFFLTKATRKYLKFDASDDDIALQICDLANHAANEQTIVSAYEVIMHIYNEDKLYVHPFSFRECDGFVHSDTREVVSRPLNHKVRAYLEKYLFSSFYSEGILTQ